jgi:starch phosphorylase
MVFRKIDRLLWDDLSHNPVAFLNSVSRPCLNAVTNDRTYLELYDRTMERFDRYMTAGDTWFKKNYPNLTDRRIAYFSFEFGLHESLPVYAGGLGILSGDHLKEASDMDLPLAGIGFIYNQGYFTQHITEDGWQETGTHYLNFQQAPIIPLRDDKDQPVTISVELPGRTVHARLWEVRVGRVPLFLLDTNLEINSPADRQLTDRLYSNDLEIRISQEILLGMGGVRALRRLGYEASVWHMNEGHSAFLALERIFEKVRQGKSFDEAAGEVRKTNIFTTHTPVPAGNDQFPMWLIDKYFTQLWPELGLTRDQFLQLGYQNQAWGESFVMPVLALHLSDYRNAVSELHGEVSRHMWNNLWPDTKVEDVPITHITNGVHTSTWMGRRLHSLFDTYLGKNWREEVDNPDMWAQIDNIPDEELWAARQHMKLSLMLFANERARQQWMKGEVHPIQVIASGTMLEPYSLTIGFARRFATYKRATLILRDIDRLIRLITAREMPVQFIFAGKAHPADEPGKLLIQEVYRAVKNNRTGGRLVFLEDYDMNIARHMVQGVDVWMNTPRRPMEASGTSGMKAALNGGLNFSVLDGWWREGFNGRNGWAIGEDTTYASASEQDEMDPRSLYDTLENEIIPLYYRRGPDNIPHEWLARVRDAIRTLGPQFSTRRMLKEYMYDLYLPAMQTAETASARRTTKAKEK